MKTVEQVRKEMVKAIEEGSDLAPLEKELADIRASVVAEADRAELQKIVADRQALRDRAQAIQASAQKQREAIDAFLKLRDSIISPLSKTLEEIGQLPALQLASQSQYYDVTQLIAAARLPNGYLPQDFTAPVLAMMNGHPIQDAAAHAVFYLQAGYGLLANLTKEERPVPARPAVGLEAIDNDPYPDPYPDPPCTICQHPEKESIDKAIKEGTSLRDIADKYGSSKSTLSRHKAHMNITEVTNETN